MDPWHLKGFWCGSSSYALVLRCREWEVILDSRCSWRSKFSPLCVLWLHDLGYWSAISEKHLRISSAGSAATNPLHQTQTQIHPGPDSLGLKGNRTAWRDSNTLAHSSVFPSRALLSPLQTSQAQACAPGRSLACLLVERAGEPQSAAQIKAKAWMGAAELHDCGCKETLWALHHLFTASSADNQELTRCHQMKIH